MKTSVKLVFVLSLIIIIILSMVAVMKSRTDYNVKALPDAFTVTAHSGSEGTEDNSTDFLKKCVELNVQVLEIDLTFREDGTPVLLHKDVAANNEGVLFDEAVKYISDNSDTIKINIDLKSVANLPAVVEILDKYGMRERCFYTGVGESFVEAVRRDGGLPYYLNLDLSFFKKYSDSELQSALEKVKSAGAIGINCSYKYACAKMVKLFHGNGLLVSYWTANTETVMKRLLAIAPDNITTRYPVKLTQLVNRENQ